jgi:hypothetical protein
MALLITATRKAKHLPTVYYGRAGKPWIVIRFPAADVKCALLEAFDMYLRGVITLRELDGLQQRIFREARRQTRC